MSPLIVWNAWKSQMAVFAGSAAALLALLQKAPVHIACLRGAGAWLAVTLVGRLVSALLERVEQSDAERAAAEAAARAAAQEEGQ
ncbi:MAG: hypothetical protein R3F17_01405 [Planctomycetota bacterium]